MEGWKLATFEYCGPCNSSFTLPPETEGGQTTDVLLYIGKPVELPAENEYVKSLLFQGYLKPVAEEKPVAIAKSSKKPATEGEG